MEFGFAPHMSFGLIGEEAVVLDLGADRYVRLGAAQASELVNLAAPRIRSCDRGILAALAERGILARGSDIVPVPVVALPVRGSALESGFGDEGPILSAPRCRLRATEVGAARLGAGLWLRWAGLAATMARWQALRPEIPARGDDDLDSGCAAVGASVAADTLARSYADARRVVPARRRCVPDSLALLRCLWRHGHDAELYFGVRLTPFAAHCWVQAAGQVLSDPLDSIAEFTPVFRL